MPVEVIKEIVKEKVVEGPADTNSRVILLQEILKPAATLIANSEMNVNDLSTEEIITMLKDLSARRSK